MGGERQSGEKDRDIVIVKEVRFVKELGQRRGGGKQEERLIEWELLWGFGV